MRDHENSELDLRYETTVGVRVYYERDRQTYKVVTAWLEFDTPHVGEGNVEISRELADQIIAVLQR